MPFDVTMPDGTVITGVPDGTTKAQLAAKYQSHVAKTEPNTLVDVARSIPGGLAKGVAGLVGIPGDIKAAADAGTQAVLQGIGLGKQQGEAGTVQAPQILPTSQQVADTVAAPFGGFYQPQTTAGEYAQTAAEFAPAALSPGGAVARAARVLVPAVASETAGQLTKGGPYEAPARAAGALAGGMGKAGYDLAKAGIGRAVAGSGATEAAQSAHDAGYALPPNMASDKPGVVSQVLSMGSGKMKLQQAASAKNQPNTNRLAAEALGLPPDAALDAATFKAVRDQANKAYGDVAKAVPSISTDLDFAVGARQLGRKSLADAAKAFPELVKNGEIEKLSRSLASKDTFSPQAGIELVRHLRAEAVSNLKAFDKPKQQALGLAQRQAAEEIDDLIERRLTQQGKPDLVSKYRAARQQIARSYDVETATDPAGNVNARIIGALQKKGRPLTGQLKDIAEAARNFPLATRNPSQFGGTESLGIIDAGMAGLSHGATLPISLARPGIRSALLSSPYQNALMGAPASSPGILNALSGNPVANLLALPNAMRPENAFNSPVNSAR